MLILHESSLIDIALSDAARRRYSHVARIEEEVGSGMPRVPACQRCIRKGYASCRVYTPAARYTYEGKSGGLAKCARCRYDGQRCL